MMEASLASKKGSKMTIPEHGKQRKKTAKIANVQKQLHRLNEDILESIEEDERFLRELCKAKGDVYAALRRSKRRPTFSGKTSGNLPLRAFFQEKHSNVHLATKIDDNPLDRRLKLKIASEPAAHNSTDLAAFCTPSNRGSNNHLQKQKMKSTIERKALANSREHVDLKSASPSKLAPIGVANTSCIQNAVATELEKKTTMQMFEKLALPANEAPKALNHDDDISMESI